ncbi:MAG: helix-turn-helix domain-containing protein [Dehalococcoidia bacterium]|jgi:DNA-binding MarR family transcriptional regulator
MADDKQAGQIKIEPGSKINWGSKFPFFMVPNSVFDMDIQIAAYERAGHAKGVNEKAVVKRGIKPAEMLVYFYLARCCNAASQDAFPSYSTIARKCRLSRSTVFEAIDMLTRSGLIIKKNRQQKIGERVPNHYLLMHPEDLGCKESELPITPGNIPEPTMPPGDTVTIPPGGNNYTAGRHLKILSYKKKDQQRTIRDCSSIGDRGCNKKDVVVESMNQLDSVEQVIDYAARKGIDVSEDCARDFLAVAGSIDRAIIAVDRAAVSALSKLRRGEQIHNPAGLLFKALGFNSGAKLNLKNLDSEKKKRLAEKEKKYKDIYLS